MWVAATVANTKTFWGIINRSTRCAHYVISRTGSFYLQFNRCFRRPLTYPNHFYNKATPFLQNLLCSHFSFKCIRFSVCNYRTKSRIFKTLASAKKTPEVGIEPTIPWLTAKSPAMDIPGKSFHSKRPYP